MKNHRIPSTVLILLAVPGTALARTALQGQQHPVIVSALFEPPTQDELDTILAQWDARDTRGLNWVVEAEGTYAGRQLDVVSHTVDGERHYAAVRYPATPGASHPVLLLNHGGAQGAPVGPLLQLFDDLTAGACAEDEYVVVVPSYRPQTLAMPAGWVPDDPGPLLYVSEGEISIGDREVDDVLALLDAVLQNVPGADPTRVVAVGESLGGTVSELAAIRDQRVSAVVSLFGWSDLLIPSLEAFAEDYLEQCWQIPPDCGATSHELCSGLIAYAEESLVVRFGVHCLLRNPGNVAGVRQKLIRRSPARFASRLPRLQLHHGELDSAISYEQSVSLAATMAGLGRGAPCFEYFQDPNGTHDSYSLSQAGVEVGAFLCAAAGSPGPGHALPYGEGCSASGGAVPRLGVHGCYEPSGEYLLSLTNAPAGSTAYFFAGTAEDAQPFGPCTTLIGGTLTPLGAVTVSASGVATLPQSTYLTGASRYYQAIVAGPIMTQGVRVVFP